jgi:hypothetical protein
MPHEEAILEPIKAMRLLSQTWKALQRENIATLERPRAAADRIGRFDTVRHKAARIAWAELRRLIARDRSRDHSSHPAPH